MESLQVVILFKQLEQQLKCTDASPEISIDLQQIFILRNEYSSI